MSHRCFVRERAREGEREREREGERERNEERVENGWSMEMSGSDVCQVLHSFHTVKGARERE